MEHLMAHIDIFPTLVGLGGGSISQPLPLDGVGQWNTILGGPGSRSELLHNYDISTVLVRNFQGALRVGNYKLLRFGPLPDGGHKQTEELYDVVADPYETLNLRNNKSMVDIFERMKARLDQFQKEVVPCWCNESSSTPGVCAGTGYIGNCDEHGPKCASSSTPAAYLPGWCNLTEPVAERIAVFA